MKIHIWSKNSVFHNYLYVFNYPMSFSLFNFSVKIEFCFRYDLSQTLGLV